MLALVSFLNQQFYIRAINDMSIEHKWTKAVKWPYSTKAICHLAVV